MSKHKVSILNALNRSDLPSMTSLARAQRYVDEGRAEWVVLSRSISFRVNHHCHQAAVACHRRLDSQTERGYDGVGRIRLDQIAGIPVLFASKLIRGKYTGPQ